MLTSNRIILLHFPHFDLILDVSTQADTLVVRADYAACEEESAVFAQHYGSALQCAEQCKQSPIRDAAIRVQLVVRIRSGSSFSFTF